MHHDDDYYNDHNFTVRFDSNDGKRSVEMNFSELYLNDILTQFRDFLRGCGYEIDGEIAVVPWEVIQPTQVPVEQSKKFSFEHIPNNNWPFDSPNGA
jgi:hypothetical protein